MGGIGSTRWADHLKRKTVDQSITLSIHELIRTMGVSPGMERGLEAELTLPGQPLVPLRVTFLLDLRDIHNASLLVLSRTPDNEIGYTIPLSSTELPTGGLRWWMHCPAADCSRRVSKLHIPPGAHVFACRNCHDLTYLSCQRSHKGDRFLRFLSNQIGEDSLDIIKAALK